MNTNSPKRRKASNDSDASSDSPATARSDFTLKRSGLDGKSYTTELYEDAARLLHAHGVVVLKLYGNGLERMRTTMDDCVLLLHNSPIFEHTPVDWPVLTAFGASADPHMFHAPCVRSAEHHIYDEVSVVLRIMHRLFASHVSREDQEWMIEYERYRHSGSRASAREAKENAEDDKRAASIRAQEMSAKNALRIAYLKDRFGHRASLSQRRAKQNAQRAAEGKKPMGPRRISGETLHRDTSPRAIDGEDTVYGGWYNHGPSDSVFSCVPGSQLDSTRTQGVGVGGGSIFGFEKASAAHEAAARDGSQLTMTQVLVPPGCLVIFDQTLLHEVASGVIKDAYRLWFGMLVTQREGRDHPMMEGLDEALDEQSIVRIKSDQIPTLYEKMSTANPVALDEYASQLVPQMREPMGNNGLFKPVRVAPSVRALAAELGIGKPYPDYSEEERAMYFPHSMWEE